MYSTSVDIANLLKYHDKGRAAFLLGNAVVDDGSGVWESREI